MSGRRSSWHAASLRGNPQVKEMVEQLTGDSRLSGIPGHQR